MLSCLSRLLCVFRGSLPPTLSPRRLCPIGSRGCNFELGGCRHLLLGIFIASGSDDVCVLDFFFSSFLFFFFFVRQTESQHPLPFRFPKPRCGEQGASKLSGGPGALACSNARWATRPCDSPAARCSPTGTCLPGVCLLFYFPSSHVSGLEGVGPGTPSPPVCVAGVLCVSFLVLGLMIAVLLPGAHVLLRQAAPGQG